MLAMARPHYFMPVHGEAVHLRAHAHLAEQMGIRSDHIFIADNGDALEVRNGKVSWGASRASSTLTASPSRMPTPSSSVIARSSQAMASSPAS